MMSQSYPRRSMMAPFSVTQTLTLTPLSTPWSRNPLSTLNLLHASATWPWWLRWRKTRLIMTEMASHTTPSTSTAMRDLNLWQGASALWQVPPLVQTWIMTSWTTGGRGSGPWLSCMAWMEQSIAINTDGWHPLVSIWCLIHTTTHNSHGKYRRKVWIKYTLSQTNAHGSRLWCCFASGQECLSWQTFLLLRPFFKHNFAPKSNNQLVKKKFHPSR